MGESCVLRYEGWREKVGVKMSRTRCGRWLSFTEEKGNGD